MENVNMASPAWHLCVVINSVKYLGNYKYNGEEEQSLIKVPRRVIYSKLKILGFLGELVLN